MQHDVVSALIAPPRLGVARQGPRLTPTCSRRLAAVKAGTASMFIPASLMASANGRRNNAFYSST
jgi:hypothetical protein